MAIKIKQIERAGSSWSERLYLPAVFAGLKRTLEHFTTNLQDTSNIVFTEYPEQMPEDITIRYRGHHRLTKHDDGTIKCVACDMCATNCPADCIFIDAEERYDGVSEKMPKEFKIDLLECVYCGFCVEACPHDAIRMDSGIFVNAGDSRESFVVNKEYLLSIDGMKEEK